MTSHDFFVVSKSRSHFDNNIGLKAWSDGALIDSQHLITVCRYCFLPSLSQVLARTKKGHNASSFFEFKTNSRVPFLKGKDSKIELSRITSA